MKATLTLEEMWAISYTRLALLRFLLNFENCFLTGSLIGVLRVKEISCKRLFQR